MYQGVGEFQFSKGNTSYIMIKQWHFKSTNGTILYKRILQYTLYY